MIITYHGAGMIKVAHGEWLAVFNPIGRAAVPDGRQADLRPRRFGADLALVSLDDPAGNGVKEVTFGGRRPFVVDGPGEYEQAGTFIRGFASKGPESKINTVYDLAIDGKHLVHLGALADPNLSPAVKEGLVPVDILFMPVGQPRLAARTAYQLALTFNPRVIIPVYYTRETLKQFLMEASEEEVKPLDKLGIKGKELADKEAEIVVLEAV